jgi:acyl-CoA synthetase (AMP-forming)/AMP-acid ligase II
LGGDDHIDELAYHRCDDDDAPLPWGLWTGPDDHALLLLTSGTTGKKKVVPYRLRTIVEGAACIAKGWDLQPHDVNLNMMPLFHIGGIARNVFAPILSGGGVILAPGFDPHMFWDVLESGGPVVTWYYASPTMHQAYCDEAARRLSNTNEHHHDGRGSVSPTKHGAAPRKKVQLRFIANAAGSLLPALADIIQKTFGCTVLPGKTHGLFPHTALHQQCHVPLTATLVARALPSSTSVIARDC